MIGLKNASRLFKSYKIAILLGAIVLIVFSLTVPSRVRTILTGPLAKYETTKVKRETISQTISASGEIRAEKQVTLTFQTSGQLAWVGIKEGDRVKAWQAIAALDRRELEKDLKKKLLAYMNERWDFEQTQEDYNIGGRPLEKVGVLTEAERRILQKAQFDLNSTVLDVEIKDLAYKLATIITPIAGIVTKIDVPIAGVNITPATAEFVVADPSQMKFVANVDETDIGLVNLGQKGRVLLDAYADEEFEGVVTKIAFSSITTRGGGTAFEIEISLPENTDQRFKVGMNGDAEIILAEKEEVLSVPTEAIETREGKTYVEIVEGRRLKEVEVETGISSDTRIEIVKGLNQDQIIVTGEKTKKQ